MRRIGLSQQCPAQARADHHDRSADHKAHVVIGIAAVDDGEGIKYHKLHDIDCLQC